MRNTAIIPASPTDGVFLCPVTEQGRYEISACVGAKQVITYSDDLDVAEAAFDVFFVRQFADDKDAHGGIYDRDERRYVRNWRGGPKKGPQVHPMMALLERAVASGQPVSVIGADIRVDFNVVAGSDH